MNTNDSMNCCGEARPPKSLGSVAPRLIVSGVLLLALALVIYPRFNRQDIGPLKSSIVGRASDGTPSMGDAPEYVNCVRYYRGEISKNQLTTPFAYRAGVPYVAALLPVKDPMTAINCINYIGLALALFFLHKTMLGMGYGFREVVIGDFIFVFSFPVFYYGAIGLVDPVWLTALAAGLFCLYRQQWVWLCGVVAVGALIRETTIVLVVVTAVYLLVVSPRRWFLIMTLVALAFVLPSMGTRIAFDDLGHYVWKPSLFYLHQNLRLRAAAAMLLSLGIPGMLILIWIVRTQCRNAAVCPRVWIPMLAGIMCVLGLSAFAFVAAYADGRFLWAVSLFGMPFCIDVLGSKKRLENPDVR